MRGKPITPEEYAQHSAPGLTDKQIRSRVHNSRRLAITGIEVRRQQRRESYFRNREVRMAQVRAYQEAHPEKVQLWKRRWEEAPENREAKRKYSQERARVNKDKLAVRLRDWRKRNPEKVKQQKARAYRKVAGTVREVLENRLRCNLHHALRRVGGAKHGRSLTLVGFSLGELRQHLERNFLPGMGWHNTKAWHIDHVLPLSLWVYSSPEDPEFKAAWSLENLRPLWAKQNIAKSNKLPELSDFPKMEAR